MKTKSCKLIRITAQNKRLLGVVCMLIFSLMGYAGGGSNKTKYYAQCHVKVATNSTGMGKVYVSTSSQSVKDSQYSDEASTGENENSTSTSKDFYLYAKAKDHFIHVGWSSVPNGETLCPNSNADEYKYTISELNNNTSSTSRKEETLYAVFKPSYRVNLYPYNVDKDDFSNTPIGQEKWQSEYSYAIEITQNKLDSIFRIELNHPQPEINYGAQGGVSSIECHSEVFNCSIQTIGDYRVLRVQSRGIIDGTVTGDIQLIMGDDVTTLHLMVTNEPIVVTLNPADNLSGTYTYTQQTTGSKSFSVTTSPVIKQMQTSTDYIFTFSNPIPRDAQQQFDKWVIRDVNGKTITESSVTEFSYRFSGGESITPVFSPSDRATFIVKSEPNTRYVDLQLALDRAAALKTSTGNEQVVVVVVDGERKGGRLVKGDYVIRNGVTLLVPENNSNTPLTGDLSSKSFDDSNPMPPRNQYCELVVDDETTITVKDGNISVNANLSALQHYNGMAINHGHIRLGKNCHITVEKGGLYVFGFITGDKTSHITMKNGTKTYEAFQFTDWRGGTEASNFTSGTSVFITGQYYIQNIEVPITFEYGASEYLSTCVSVTLLGKQEANIQFIGKYSDEYGLFGLGENTTITKSYDPVTDRLKFDIQGSGIDGQKSKIGHMQLKVRVTIDSKNYVMPIQNNIDITVKDATVDVQYDMAFLPGSTLLVSDNSVINVEKNAYVYDRGARKWKDGESGGYWSALNSIIMPLPSTARPGGIKTPARSEADLIDAKLVVNGRINVNGCMYTVKGDFPEDEEGNTIPQGGANITSDGGGTINVKKLGTATQTYQWDQALGGKQKTIAISDPKLLLHNDTNKGAEIVYTSVNSTGTYTYYQHDGTWRLPQAGITGVRFYDNNHNDIEEFYITLPTVKEETGYLLATLESISGLTYNLTDFDVTIEEGGCFSLNGNVTIENGKLRIPVKYDTQKKNATYEQLLTITRTNSANFSMNDIVVRLKATEDYTPEFTVPAELNIYARINEETPIALPILSSEDNVVNLFENQDVEGFGWEITCTREELFSFEFGEEGNKLAGAKVVFTPRSIDNISAVLTLTARYTDAADVTKECKRTINLAGNGLIVDNTMEFNELGRITKNSSSFELLQRINSTGEIKITTTPTEQQILSITSNTENLNYTIKPLDVGQVELTVKQLATDTHTEKIISKTFVVVEDERSLLEVSCVGDKESFDMLTADLQGVAFNDNVMHFSDNSTWTAHFSDMPGVLSFTPEGDGYWAIEESSDGTQWSEVVWWTQLPSGKPTTVALYPTSRRVRISYNKLLETGTITNLCITPFSIHTAEETIYVPVTAGSVQTSHVEFMHSQEEVIVNGPEGWNIMSSTGPNMGGVLNTFYQTTVTLSGGTDVQEQNDAYTLTATQGGNSASIKIGTYMFPKPLPMRSEQWRSDNNESNNINGYDESELYYHYMQSSSHVKWDGKIGTLVFMNRGSHIESDRQVVFGYYGHPSEMRFKSLSTDWYIEESENGSVWNAADIENRTIDLIDGVNSITQPLNHASKYVRITYKGSQQTEVQLFDLVIEGFPSAVADPIEVEVSKGEDLNVTPFATFNIHVMNLDKIKLVLDNIAEFKLYHGHDNSWNEMTNDMILTYSDYAFLAMNEVGDITIKVEWIGDNLVNEGHIKILNPDQSDSELANVRLVGKKNGLTAADANTGIWTGVPDGESTYRPTQAKYTLQDDNNNFEEYIYHEVNVSNTFDANGKALFDYLFIYGETTTVDGSTTITSPDRSRGSNAKTPYYIYQKSADGFGYDFIQMVENANTAFKTSLDKIGHEEVITGDENKVYYAIQPDGETPLNVYITGFCPYATTGSSKDDEGVWYFRGKPGQYLNVYIENCHIYSRNKSIYGETTAKNESPSFSDADVVHGSGAVFVFENKNPQADGNEYFNVSIHTRGHNLLKSNFGCYYTMIGTAQVTQVSSPIQIRLGARNDYMTARTTLNFDDLWPLGEVNGSILEMHTNGFLSLQKLVNNAPSIDLGNANTIVNFNGGQIQLQNAQIVSSNYKTTLAISHRSGIFGNFKDLPFAYGVGTDAVGGTVNFNDGTTTVLPMEVEEAHRGFYLMDVDENGNELATTSCLRTPKNTFIYGGSHCMIRACSDVTSKGGAPKDGPNGKLLGRYIYTNNPDANPAQGYTFTCVFDALPDIDNGGYQEGSSIIHNGQTWQVQNGEWMSLGYANFADPCYRVELSNFPGNLQYNGAPLSEYYASYPNREYGINSVTPDSKGNLYLWIPEGVVPGVTPEKDKLITIWKACMTEIEAGAMGITGAIGGSVTVEVDEEVHNLVYCQLDDDIYDVISQSEEYETENGTTIGYLYKAPVVDPTGKLEGDERYQRISPTHVGANAQEQITSSDDYEISNKIYYITTAMADTWMNFNMPFDVEKIWVVESYPEQLIEEYFDNIKGDEEKLGDATPIEVTKRFQAQHNADFAAFFGVAMAIGADHLNFEDIYDRYIDWAMNIADKEGVAGSTGLYNGEDEYTLRGKYPLAHYDGSNFTTSNFYLYKNNGDWIIRDANKSQFTTQWQIVPKVAEGGVLMEKGETYSMLFPYCQGCDVEIDENGNIIKDKDGLPVVSARDYWDYWSGKFLIFESTTASTSKPHVIKGSNYIAENKVGNADWIFDNCQDDPSKAMLLGNNTFAMMNIESRQGQIYTYLPQMGGERFYSSKVSSLTPTSTFLLTKTTSPIKLITRSGQIVYDTTGNGNNPSTGGNIPTVGGGNDLFVTETAGGINVAVAAPQQVRVISSTGAVLYSGMVQTSVDVAIPTTGVYVVAGENEVQKILY